MTADRYPLTPRMYPNLSSSGRIAQLDSDLTAARARLAELNRQLGEDRGTHVQAARPMLDELARPAVEQHDDVERLLAAKIDRAEAEQLFMVRTTAREQLQARIDRAAGNGHRRVAEVIARAVPEADHEAANAARLVVEADARVRAVETELAQQYPGGGPVTRREYESAVANAERADHAERNEARRDVERLEGELFRAELADARQHMRDQSAAHSRGWSR